MKVLLGPTFSLRHFLLLVSDTTARQIEIQKDVECFGYRDHIQIEIEFLSRSIFLDQDLNQYRNRIFLKIEAIT